MGAGRRGLPALLAALALLGASCSGRERSNPLDPGNPDTHGAPAAFTALAAGGRVHLSWVPLRDPRVVGYALWRRAPGEADFQPLGDGELPPEAASHDDLGLTDDSTYAYRIAFRLAAGGTGPVVEAAARPGPGAIWVADAGADLVYRLSPDGRHRVLALHGLDTPAEVAVDAARDRVWASSRTTGYVAVWQADGQLVDAEGAFGAPSALSVAVGASAGWVAEERFGEVSLWEPGSGFLHRAEVGGLPAALVAVPGTASAWVADREGRRLVSVATATAPTAVPVPGGPWRLAWDALHEELWVSYPEDGAVERRAADGALRTRVTGLPGAFALAVDAARDRVWVTLTQADAAVALDRQGTVVCRVGRLPQPRGIAVDERTGEVWVSTLGAGDGHGAVRLLSPAGAPLQELTGFTRPFAVAVDPVL